MKVNGSMIKLMDMVYIDIWMVHYMRVCGMRTNNMVRDGRHGQTMQCMRVTMLRARNMEEDNSSGLTDHNIKENSKIII